MPPISSLNATHGEHIPEAAPGYRASAAEEETSPEVGCDSQLAA